VKKALKNYILRGLGALNVANGGDTFVAQG
jgi:hypothetical protein